MPQMMKLKKPTVRQPLNFILIKTVVMKLNLKRPVKLTKY